MSCDPSATEKLVICEIQPNWPVVTANILFSGGYYLFILHTGYAHLLRNVYLALGKFI